MEEMEDVRSFLVRVLGEDADSAMSTYGGQVSELSQAAEDAGMDATAKLGERASELSSRRKD